MFAKELHGEGHVKRFSIRESGKEGWEVREEQDNTVVRNVHYTDWHRVERALHVFALQIGQLEDRGWHS
jgi:hypothetical protein